jgi:hypothetical protein
MNVLNMPFLLRAQKAFGQRLAATAQLDSQRLIQNLYHKTPLLQHVKEQTIPPAFLRLVQKNAYLSFVITVT